MSFVHVGLALAGLAAISIPIIIHLLFRQRRHPIRWGAMRFLAEAFRKARKRMRLEQWLLLAIRCLIIGLLGVALARPLMTGSGLQFMPGGGRAVYLLIDDSLASSLVSGVEDDPSTRERTTALDRHKKAALAVIDALGPTDRVGLISLSKPISAIVDPPAIDHRAVRDLIGKLGSSDAGADLPSALLRLRESIGAQDDDPAPVIVYLLCDFRAGSVDLGEPLPPVLGDEVVSKRPGGMSLIAAQPASQVVANVQIVSMSPARSVAVIGATDLSGLVSVSLRRVGYTAESGISTVRLSAGSIRSPEPVVVHWAPGQTEADIDFRLDLTGSPVGELVVTALIDQDPLEADNRRSRVLDVRRSLRVAVIDRREFGGTGRLETYTSGSWLRRALAPGDTSLVLLEDIDPAAVVRGSLRDVGAAVLTRPDLITDVGWDALGEFVELGGLLWIVPPHHQRAALWTDKAAQALKLTWTWAREVVRTGTNTNGGGNNGGSDGPTPPPAPLGLSAQQPQTELLKMLSGELSALARPVNVFQYLPVVDGLEPGAVALELEDGTPFLISAMPTGGRGMVLYLASAVHLEWTSLPAKPLMVALAQETIRQGLGMIRSRSRLQPGDRPILPVPVTATSLLGPDGQSIGLRVSGAVVRPVQELQRAGLYRVRDAREQPLSTIAVNVAPDAARTEVQSAGALLSWLGGSGSWTMQEGSDDPAAMLARQSSLTEASLILLAIVLGLAIVETILARYFSYARRTQAAIGLEAPDLGAAIGPGGAASAPTPLAPTLLGSESRSSPAAHHREQAS